MIDIDLTLTKIDTTLQTSCLVSLQTEEGWWGDFMRDRPLGCRLHTFKRSKKTPDTAEGMREEVSRALNWIVREERAKNIKVSGDFKMDVLIDGVKYVG